MCDVLDVCVVCGVVYVMCLKCFCRVWCSVCEVFDVCLCVCGEVCVMCLICVCVWCVLYCA